MPVRLLVIEDDDLLGAAIQKALTRSGHAVDWIRKGNDMAAAMHSHTYDAVLLDLGLPDVGGEVLLKHIRQHHPEVNVVVMTARGAVHDRVSLLDIGADDYMVKPIDLDEVAARLRAVARRTGATPGAGDVLEHGALRLTPSAFTATWFGETVQLTSKEYRVLETFVRRKNQVLSRAQIEEALYGWGEENCSNTVEVYVHFLRRKFGSGLIQTVRGLGYQLCPVSAMAPIPHSAAAAELALKIVRES